jgi:RNA polymerase sigma-70 factor (ECF subfamily)
LAKSDSRFSTSLSLLERVRQDDPEAWRKFCAFYGPVVYRWARRSELQPEDAADIVQEVFCSAASSIGLFNHSGSKAAFRGWLRTITRNKIVDHVRKQASSPIKASAAIERLAGPEDNHENEEDVSEDEIGEDNASEDDLLVVSTVVRRAIDLMQTEFEETTWRAFWQTAVEGRSGADVAENLGLTIGAVYKSKSRVLRKLRDELDGLL